MSTTDHSMDPTADDVAGVLAPVTAGDDAALRGLRGRLARAAEDAGLLDVAYRTIDSPLGPLLVAATEQGLVRVAFEREGHQAVLETLAARVSPRVLEAPARLSAVARQMEEYFTGRRTAFDLPLDLRLSGGFRRTVLTRLREVGYGRTTSYAALAAAAGSPRAVRAVGSACATNPLPVVVPCHRVVRADGSLGGYLGGLSAKQTLLMLEQSAPR